MNLDVKLADNLTVTYGELNNWAYDENDKQYPICFQLTIRFYDKEYEAYLSHERLLKKDTDPIMFQGPSVLHDSLYRMLEDGDYKDEIISICDKIWEYERDEDDEEE